MIDPSVAPRVDDEHLIEDYPKNRMLVLDQNGKLLPLLAPRIKRGRVPNF